ncbi:hypothetical protein JF535_09410 [Microbulbifer salipaludis]|uniref:DUF3619 family protein n=1 Tax=Microbulbifer salipaludis TaxID=187980 RepID=A0ABS3E6X5_9GAMM|nr:hypothetical protein [Microbulbifer salipaludis]MBN8431065.1 hypothetical protein [Microbulbifer salipaludis]
MTPPKNPSPGRDAAKPSDDGTRRPGERDLVAGARAAMDRRDASLDGETLSHLRRARAAALDANDTSVGPTVAPWLPVGLASAAVVAIAIAVVWPGTFTQPAKPIDMLADAWILDEEAELEMIQDVEFYQWLAEEAPDGYSS